MFQIVDIVREEFLISRRRVPTFAVVPLQTEFKPLSTIVIHGCKSFPLTLPLNERLTTYPSSIVFTDLIDPQDTQDESRCEEVDEIK